MNEHIFVVFTNAVDGRDEEFNEWCDHQHLGDILRVPGIDSAQRFEQLPISLGSGQTPIPYRYLERFDFTTNPEELLQNFLAASRSWKFSDAQHPDRISAAFKALGPPRTA